MFWKKKKVVEKPLLPIPEKVLTGIERMELEETEKRRQKCERETKAQIAALEKEIGPQLAILQQLRSQLYPYQFQNMAMQNISGQGLYQPPMSQPLLSSLLGWL